MTSESIPPVGPGKFVEAFEWIADVVGYSSRVHEADFQLNSIHMIVMRMNVLVRGKFIASCTVCDWYYPAEHLSLIVNGGK